MDSTRYGIVGVGRMGGSLVRNLVGAGGQAVAYDVNPDQVKELAGPNVIGARTLADLAEAISPPRVIWIMVPAGAPVDAAIDELRPHLAAGDVLVDGGNSFYRDSLRRAAALKESGIYYLDCGSSGGMEGALNGLCLMVGGEPAAFRLAEPLLKAISQQGGYAHVGPSGSGHFVKMVHNGIEYGMLQAIGEGLELLESGPYELDLAQVTELWQHGSVIRSWLMELAGRAFRKDPHLERLEGAVGGGDTGNWAIEEAWKAGVPMPAIAMAYAMRLRSRQEDTFAGKVVSALRYEFGGHGVKAKLP